MQHSLKKFLFFHQYLKRMAIVAIFSFAVCCALGVEWKKATRDYSWSFPRDHAAHRSAQTEWWYFTGHLVSKEDPTRKFGYQFTFFRIGLTDQKTNQNEKWVTPGLIMGHAAITDVTKQTHLFSHFAYRESPLFGEFADTSLSSTANKRITNLGWSLAAPGSDGKWLLSWNGQAFDFSMTDTAQRMAFNLSTTPLKPLIFEGPNGFSQKSQQGDAGSLYYSFTRLKTQGQLQIDGSTFSVDGISWMDKEFSSNQLDKNQRGWDWFSLQLQDGRELMLYIMRNEKNETDFSRGTVVSEKARNSDGVRYISEKDWKLTVTKTWTSMETQARYPSAWTLSIPSEKIDLIISSLVADQENRGTGPGLPYWEGAVQMTDKENRVVGQGYVELTGYAKKD